MWSGRVQGTIIIIIITIIKVKWYETRYKCVTLFFTIIKIMIAIKTIGEKYFALHVWIHWIRIWLSTLSTYSPSAIIIKIYLLYRHFMCRLYFFSTCSDFFFQLYTFWPVILGQEKDTTVNQELLARILFIYDISLSEKCVRTKLNRIGLNTK